MGAASGRLTEAKIKSYVSAAKPVQHNDGGGLYFRLRASNKKGLATVARPEWLYRYTLQGKPKLITIGRYPQMSLAEARCEAARLLGLKDTGVDPAASRSKLLASKPYLVDDLVVEWVKRQVEPSRHDWERVESQLRRYVLPVLGSIPVAAVHPLDVDKVLSRAVDAGYPTVANDLLRHMKRMFKWARVRQHCEINPAADFEAEDAGGQESARGRFLDESELKALFTAIDSSITLGIDNALTIKILLSTCVRKGDLVRARWQHVDLEKGAWHLPDRPSKRDGARNKKAGALLVPLVPPVQAWFRALKVMAGGSEWVLPARRVSAPGRNRFMHISPDTVNLALSKVTSEIEHVTVHDLRRTARTHLARLGVDEAVAERCLNHKAKGIVRVYDQWEYFDERKDALGKWANYLVEIGA